MAGRARCVGSCYIDISQCAVKKKDVKEEDIGYKFERGHSVLYDQICIIYYVPSIHNIHQDKMQ